MLHKYISEKKTIMNTIINEINTVIIMDNIHRLKDEYDKTVQKVDEYIQLTKETKQSIHDVYDDLYRYRFK